MPRNRHHQIASRMPSRALQTTSCGSISNMSIPSFQCYPRHASSKYTLATKKPYRHLCGELFMALPQTFGTVILITSRARAGHVASQLRQNYAVQAYLISTSMSYLNRHCLLSNASSTVLICGHCRHVSCSSTRTLQKMPLLKLHGYGCWRPKLLHVPSSLASTEIRWHGSCSHGRSTCDESCGGRPLQRMYGRLFAMATHRTFTQAHLRHRRSPWRICLTTRTSLFCCTIWSTTTVHHLTRLSAPGSQMQCQLAASCTSYFCHHCSFQFPRCIYDNHHLFLCH